MMTLDNNQEKIGKICEVLRKETLEPAERRAKEIVQEAETRAHELIAQAEQRAEELLVNAKREIVRERELFQSSMRLSAEQGLEYLRQEIESKLFNPALQRLVQESSSSPKMVAALINALVKAIEQEGLVTDLEAHIPKQISPQQVNAELLESVLHKLKEHSVTVGNFTGGAEVKLVGKKLTLDMRDDTLRELLSNFLRKDMRKFIFGQT